MQPIGLSFAPFANREGGGTGNGENAPSGGSPVQDAIRTLNLQIPRVTGSAPINASLLAGPGSAALPSTAGLGGLDAFLRRLFGVLQPAAGQMAGGGMTGGAGMSVPGLSSMPSAAPAPNFTPGLETGAGPAQSGPPASNLGPLTPQIPRQTPPSAAPTGLFNDPTVTDWDSPNWA